MLGVDSKSVLDCHPVKADDTRFIHSLFMTTAITRFDVLPVYQCCVTQVSASAPKAQWRRGAQAATTTPEDGRDSRHS
jgi:hypothetical protein